ncbi:endonuclease/exonuclease/phosphatase family protein [Pseudovibrio sp. Tun.PSC04-5.I4]|uniref:endonuclease/exonuclease/phosphatase family protein n=1 Tax=Pseudovibrio sp. Tun.PSC04-5.I4 TaxID=1798213 RepID=UPI001AD948F1|nr:endonuclease/exonuclease/phosphatase family protein [Pseudovibrio sp. Tun.PSC04-5.I4]
MAFLQKERNASILLRLARAGTIAVTMLLLLTFLLPGNLLTEASAFFVPQLIALGFTGLLIWIVLAKVLHWLHIASLLGLALSGYWMVTAIHQVVQSPIVSANGSETIELKVMSLNILHMMFEKQALQEMIESQQPDLISFQETASASPRLKAFLSKNYEYSVLPPKNHDTDITLFSKYPLRNAEMIYVPDLKEGSHIPKEFLSTKVEVDGQLLQLYAVHPASPRGPNRLEGRTKYFSYLTNHIKIQADKDPLVIIGDWNTPVWSNTFQRLLEELNLKTALTGILPQTTRYFLHSSLKILFGSKVDHIATSQNATIENLIIGDDIGSDHFPVFATIRFSP